jgi:hypothetical protein
MVVDHFECQGFSKTVVGRAYAVSGGAMGLMTAILASDTEHPLNAGIATAKEFLAATIYERLCRVDGIAKQKPDAEQLTDALGRLCRAALIQALETNNIVAAKRWLARLESATESLRAMQRNANTKLVLTDLSLQI